MTRPDIDHEASSGNVFTDLELAAPDELLAKAELAGFSMKRLIRFLNALDRDVRIVVLPKPRNRERATTSVRTAPALRDTRQRSRPPYAPR